MCKNIRVVLGLVFAMLIFSIISIVNQLSFPSKTAYADELINNSKHEKFIENECVYSSGSYIAFQTDKVHYLENEGITVSYVSHYENGIADISYSQNGFNVLSLNIDEEDNKVFTVNVSFEPDRVDYSLQMQVEHIGGELAFVELHGYLNEYGMFISQFSPDSAREKFYTFAKAQNLMTEEDCQQARHEFWNKDNQNSNIAVENVQASAQGESVATTTSDMIEIKGDLEWKDDNNITHPLRYVKVELYHNSISSANLLDTAYADSTGEYCLKVNRSSSLTAITAYIKVYASDGNISVLGDSAECYNDYKITRIVLNSNTADGCDFVFDMSNNIGQAMQISQALFTARNYAQTLMGEMPESVNARYPSGDRCGYTLAGIHITQRPGSIVNSYAAWDVIMHEYGHHVHSQIINSQITGGDHIPNLNLSDEYEDKDVGTKLAWSEAWATVFGMMSQQYYSNQLYNIETVGDAFYTSYNGLNYSIENISDLLGESCENSIMGVLWDLYDSEFDTNDLISLGHTAFWNLTAVDGFETFSDFVNNLYEEYPYYAYGLGLNLTYYKMATTAPVMINLSSVSQTVPPTFTWTPQGGSVFYPNNSFQLVFFDDDHQEVLRTATTTSTSYTLTQNEWQSVLYSFGCTYYVAVVAMQTAAPVTGGYISAFSSYVKPSAPALSQNINMFEDDRYIEKVVNLQPSQYIDYYVTFQSGVKLIQTFGPRDTVMEIYNSSGGLLYKSDDEGYDYNPLATLNVPSNNTQYKIRVKFFDEGEFGTVKFTIIPAFDDRKIEVEVLQSYEDIIELHSYANYTFGSYCIEGYMNVVRFTPPSSGVYAISLSSEFDNYLYVVDPRSTSILLDNIDFNDDSDEDDRNAYLTKNLEAEIQYLIVYGPYNPNIKFTDYDTGDDIIVSFRKLG